MLELIGTIGGFILVGGLCMFATEPRVILELWLPTPEQPPEMSEKLRRMTELADQAIAARQAGQPLPAEIEKYRS